MLLNARWPQRVLAMPWTVIAAIVAVGCFGLVVLYSAAGGHVMPWAGAQGARFVVLLIAMIAVAQVDPAVWIRYAYWAYGAVLAAAGRRRRAGRDRGRVASLARYRAWSGCNRPSS